MLLNFHRHSVIMIPRHDSISMHEIDSLSIKDHTIISKSES